MRVHVLLLDTEIVTYNVPVPRWEVENRYGCLFSRSEIGGAITGQLFSHGGKPPAFSQGRARQTRHGGRKGHAGALANPGRIRIINGIMVQEDGLYPVIQVLAVQTQTLADKLPQTAPHGRFQ